MLQIRWPGNNFLQSFPPVDTRDLWPVKGWFFEKQLKRWAWCCCSHCIHGQKGEREQEEHCVVQTSQQVFPCVTSQVTLALGGSWPSGQRCLISNGQGPRDHSTFSSHKQRHMDSTAAFVPDSWWLWRPEKPPPLTGLYCEQEENFVCYTEQQCLLL